MPPQGPRVSIAMATFNGGRWIKQQLDSFSDQTHRPDQLVISDDGSIDDTMEVIERFAATAPYTVEVMGNATALGVTRNFGQALAACTGDVIFFSDQDDVWLPEKVETVLCAMASSAKRLVVHDLLLADADLNIHPPSMLQRHAIVGGATFHVKGCATAVHRSLLSAALPIPICATSHDQWIHTIAETLGDRLVIDAPLGIYRIHGENTSAFRLNRLAPPHRVDRLRNDVAVWLYDLAKSEVSLMADLKGAKRLIQAVEVMEPTTHSVQSLSWLRGDAVRLEGRISRRQRSAVRRLSAQLLRKVTGPLR